MPCSGRGWPRHILDRADGAETYVNSASGLARPAEQVGTELPTGSLHPLCVAGRRRVCSHRLSLCMRVTAGRSARKMARQSRGAPLKCELNCGSPDMVGAIPNTHSHLCAWERQTRSRSWIANTSKVLPTRLRVPSRTRPQGHGDEKMQAAEGSSAATEKEHFHLGSSRLTPNIAFCHIWKLRNGKANSN